jgi:hypothetical protein
VATDSSFLAIAAVDLAGPVTATQLLDGSRGGAKHAGPRQRLDFRDVTAR